MDNNHLKSSEKVRKFKILDGYGHDGGIIFKAGTTCYRSESKTEKTSEDFIKMFKKHKHLSMIEFMWVTIVIRDYNHLIENNIFSREKYLKCDRLTDHNTVISGNARSWLEFMNSYKKLFKDLSIKKREKNLYWMAYNTIGEVLNAVNPTMFDLEFEKLKKPLEVSYVQSIEQEDKDLYNRHHWVAVKFEDISRGLIDEFVRHRTMSYGVSSTRYINNTNFNFILPSILDKKTYEIFERTVEMIENGYKELLDAGVKKDVARQLLPLGIGQEMVVAGTIEDWKRIFSIRCQPNAHWEIREVLEKLSRMDVFQ